MKRLFLNLLIGGASLFSSLHSQIPEPYASVADLPFDGQGWFANAEQLKGCFRARPIKTVVEIGSWLGSSTRFLASQIPADGKVYAVDTWRGSPLEPVHLQDPRLPYLYQLFLSNVKHAHLTNQIIPVRMDSLEAARGLNVKADLIYIDGAHDTISVYNDIRAWYPHLNEGGIICGDDWLWDSVRAAVYQAALDLNKSIYVNENFWLYY